MNAVVPVRLHHTRHVDVLEDEAAPLLSQPQLITDIWGSASSKVKRSVLLRMRLPVLFIFLVVNTSHKNSKANKTLTSACSQGLM